MKEMFDILADEQRIYDEAVSSVEAIRNGADFDLEGYAYLTEEYGKLLEELRRSIIISDATTIELYENNVDLSDKVYLDPLTGMYNRRFLEDCLKRITLSLLRSGGVLSVMMVDIDYFKKYNDNYGHSEGDICLKEVAETIGKTLLRPDDFVARYGGEEFAAVLPDTDAKGAQVLAAKILANVRARNIPHEKNEVASCVTISIGITTGDVLQGHDGGEYIKRADEALYLSKLSGRNRYTYIDFEEA